MDTFLYVFLDIFFLIFHALLVGFNMTGWVWKKTRRVHLAVLSLTIFSWIGLGFFYGFGYCPCTDWHWRIKRALGETGLPDSYIKYFLDRFTGLDWNALLVDWSVGVIGMVAFSISVRLNWRDWHRHSRL